MAGERHLINRALRWRAWDGEGLEHCRIRERDDDVVAEGAVIGGRGGTDYGLIYKVRCDHFWRVRTVDVAIAGGKRLHLRTDGKGHWTDTKGRPLTQLEGCIDVDIAATPFTNTLPIRRLRLNEDESADIRVAYVPLPSLEPEAVEQRYTKLGDDRYLYEGLFRSFRGELEVDEDGLVVDYPETFVRVKGS